MMTFIYFMYASLRNVFCNEILIFCFIGIGIQNLFFGTCFYPRITINETAKAIKNMHLLHKNMIFFLA